MHLTGEEKPPLSLPLFINSGANGFSSNTLNTLWGAGGTFEKNLSVRDICVWETCQLRYLDTEILGINQKLTGLTQLILCRKMSACQSPLRETRKEEDGWLQRARVCSKLSLSMKRIGKVQTLKIPSHPL
jgi:hypothetical protein